MKIKPILLLACIATFPGCGPMTDADKQLLATTLGSATNAAVAGYGIHKADKNAQALQQQLAQMNKNTATNNPNVGVGAPPVTGAPVTGAPVLGTPTNPVAGVADNFSSGATTPAMQKKFALLDMFDKYPKDGIIVQQEGFELADFANQPRNTYWPNLLKNHDIDKDGKVTKNEWILTL